MIYKEHKHEWKYGNPEYVTHVKTGVRSWYVMRFCAEDGCRSIERVELVGRS